MTLDVRTLALAASILCTLQSLGMVALWQLNRRIPGIGAWAASNVVNAAALSLMTLQDLTPDKFLTFVLPNALNVLGGLFFYTGTCAFTGQTIRRWITPTTLAIFFPVFLYFLYIDENVTARMYLMAALLGIFGLLNAWMLFSAAKGGWKLAANFTASIFMFGGFLSLYRIVNIWAGPAPTDNFDDTPLQVMTYLTAVIAAYLWTFGTFLMINQRQTMEINTRYEIQRQIEEELMRVREDAEHQRALRQRQLLARDLHDGLGGITANLALLATLGREEDTADARDDLMKHIESMAIEGNREIRTIMTTLESGDMTWNGWLGDLRHHASKCTEGQAIKLDWQVSGTIPAETLTDTAAAFSLLRGVKEALNNLVRHSGAGQATVSMDFQPENLRIRIQDDGRGLPDGPTHGRGLNNMQRRAEELGGSLQIVKKNGTQLRFILPLPLQFKESKSTQEALCLPKLTV
jgi:signal transduction histidine kinase